MKFAALGRTHWMMDATRLAMSRGHELVLVGTCAAAPEYRVKEADFERLAADARCPYFSDARVNDECHVHAARESGAEIAISVNWLTLFGPQIIAAFPRGILNAHAGDLPRYRGNACPNWAILNGEAYVGACSHQVIPELDAGPVVLRTRFRLDAKTYIGDVYAFLDREFPRLLVEGMEGLASGALKPEPQPADPVLSLRCHPRRPGDGQIDWRQPAEMICRLVRASAEPFAGAFTYLDRQKLVVWRARAEKIAAPLLGVPGQVVSRTTDTGEVAVLAGDGLLVLEVVQPAARERQTATNAIHSTRIRLGLDLEQEIAHLRSQVTALEERTRSGRT